MQATVSGDSSALAAEADFEKNKLDESNLGFQMLQKAGWKQGEGLGAQQAGIVAPVDMRCA